jgi:hypothetical protein
MRIVALGAIALVVLAACQETSAPQSRGNVIRYGEFGDNPPPPPIDTGTVESGGGTTYNVTYMLNKVETAGWLMFKQSDGVAVSSNAIIRYSRGSFSGEGTIGTLDGRTIDLSTADYSGSSFDTCDAPVITGDVKPGTCFAVTIDGYKFTPSRTTRIVIGE